MIEPLNAITISQHSRLRYCFVTFFIFQYRFRAVQALKHECQKTGKILSTDHRASINSIVDMQMFRHSLVKKL